MAVVLDLVLFSFFAALLLAPGFVAASRGHRATGAIFLFSLLTGWTIAGWVVCLWWASRPQRPRFGEAPLFDEPPKPGVLRCRYCGDLAPPLPYVHAACKRRYRQAANRLWSKAQLLLANRDRSGVEEIASYLERTDEIHPQTSRPLLVRAWEDAVDQFLEDGVLDEKEEQVLARYRRELELGQDDLDVHGAYTRMVKAGVLREVLAGSHPDALTIVGALPFNLQKSERLIWIWQDVRYFEEKTHREYVGRSAGVRVRVMKGVYFSTSSFRGHPVETTRTIHADTGALGLTNKHLYFAGSSKSFRIRLDKIVSFEPFEDGIGVFRDAASAKLQTFANDDGWFTYNLAVNANQVELS